MWQRLGVQLTAGDKTRYISNHLFTLLRFSPMYRRYCFLGVDITEGHEVQIFELQAEGFVGRDFVFVERWEDIVGALLELGSEIGAVEPVSGYILQTMLLIQAL